ncbi:hypothetical protein PCAR4_410080 [Paraburkholderia caribensis]|nr:hypothetical protein PCAR4_410080 [Paraburkholderia caribensis]
MKCVSDASVANGFELSTIDSRQPANLGQKAELNASVLAPRRDQHTRFS